MMIGRIEARFPDSYRNGNVLMIHGDCMDVMAEIGGKEIPLSIVDPPYGIGINKMSFCTSGSKKIGKATRRDYSKTSAWDAETPKQNYFNELVRVSKNQIIWGGNYFTNFLLPSKGWIVWDKKTEEKYSNDFADCELAWTNIGVARIFRFMWNGMLQGNQKNKEERFHPTQKPVALYKWLLTRYAKPAEIILDTHGGSGSIVIACHDLGHPIIWVEKDADYYRDAVARYKTHASQAVLFEPVEIMKEQKLFEV
jgi:site-specific DNA-methyltransferase (adenine-specific)